MNILNNLFSHHRQSQALSSPEATWNWEGQSGKEYHYHIYPLETVFEALPGNYIYAKHAADGRWVPVYIAQTRDLRQRLEGQVHLEDAVQYGATHLHAHYCSAGQAARCSEERDLILQWQPVCNERLED